MVAQLDEMALSESGRISVERMATYGAETDWAALAAADEGVASVCQGSGDRVGVDWSRGEARFVVARALLRVDFGLRYGASAEHLVPCVPNRVRFLAWVASVVGDDGSRAIRAVDVGTGASCVLAMLGARCRGWRFVASECDPRAAAEARANVARNGLDVAVVDVDTAAPPVGAALRAASEACDDGAAYDVALCNPPWFESEDERAAAAGGAPRPDGVKAAATASEAVHAAGGEVAFVRAMIADSVALGARVTWHAALLGKRRSLKHLLGDLRGETRVVDVRTTKIDLGRTTRWAVAWTVSAQTAAVDDAKVFGAKKAKRRDATRRPKTVAIAADVDAAELETRVVAFLARVAPVAAITTTPSPDLFSVRAVAPDLDLRIAARRVADGFALALEAGPATPTDAFVRVSDAIAGEVGRTNRKWRRKLARAGS